MDDETEIERRRLIEEGEAQKAYDRFDGDTWNTEELQRDFEVLDYRAPYVIVRRRDSGKVGSLMFTHQPRIYFAWLEHDDVLGTGEF